SLSLVFGLLTVPVAYWAGSAVFGRDAGWLAAGAAALCPFVSLHAQETRMYTLLVLLSLVAAAAFVLAFMRGQPRYRWVFAAALGALLYSHNWALFLAAGFALAWWALVSRGLTPARYGAPAWAAVVVAYAPWAPSLVGQVTTTGAPW